MSIFIEICNKCIKISIEVWYYTTTIIPPLKIKSLISVLFCSQLVKGVRYSIMVEIGSTQCKKSLKLSGVDTCDFFPEPHKQKVSKH